MKKKQEEVSSIFVPGLGKEVPVDQIVNINPDVDIRKAEYFILIHGTENIEYNEETQEFTRNLSTGHRSIEFIAKGRVDGHFGKYPVREGMPIDIAKIKDDSKRYKDGKEYDQKYGTNTVHTKVIPVIPEQYKASFTEMEKIKESPGIFNVIDANCNDFANNVLKPTGITISDIYTEKELKAQGKLVDVNILANWGACDKPYQVTESILVNIADKYKVPQERILSHPVDLSNPDVRIYTILPKGICPPKIEGDNVISPNIRFPFVTKPPLKQEFIDILHAINPKDYPAKFKDWPTDSWGKGVVDRGDLETIKSHLPGYKQQLANKKEAIELLHQINPQAYPARFEDWPKHIKAKKLLDSGDAKTIEKNLPVYKKNLKEKLLIDEFIDLSIKINPTSHPKDFKDWTTQWGKELVDKKDFKTIEGLLPEYRKQLANKKETIELLYQLYPQAYPPRYEDWPTHLKAKKLLDSGDAKTIEKNLLVYRQNLKEKRLIDEFIDLSIKINPNAHPKDFKDWTTQPGKELVDKKDFKTIEGVLPEYRKQLANKREAIELLHQINPQAYPARYEDWPKHIKVKKLLDSGDAKAIEKLLPVYKQNLKEKRLIDEFIDLSIKINPNAHPKDFKDWTTQWGKELVDKKDFKTIEGVLPDYRKQLANKKEAIALLHQINPQAYPARYEDWPKHIKAKKLLDSGDAKAIEKNLPVYRKLLAEKLAIDPYLTDPVGYITSLMKGIMISNSFEQLKKQCKEAVRECLSKAQKQLAKFISEQAKEENKYIENIKGQIESEVAAANGQYRSKCDIKKAELDAQVKIESDAKFIRVKAEIDLAHAGHQGNCGCPGTVTIDNYDIVAKYQPILDNFCKQYEEERDKEIAGIGKKYEGMRDEKVESIKEAIYAKQGTINEAIASLANEINKILKDAENGINTGGEVNVNSIGKQLEQSVAQFLEKAHNTVNTITVMAVHHIEYDNPVLNHPGLIKGMAEKFGSGVINKLIDFGMQFTNNQEDREVLEGICNGADSVDAMSLLMGLDVNHDVTYH